MRAAIEFAAGYRRLEEARGGVPDRVPVTAQMHEFAMALSGGTSGELYRDPAALARGIFLAAEQFGFDVPSLSYDVYNIELEALGQPILFPERSAPCPPADSLLLSRRADLARLSAPEPGKSGRMPFVLELQRIFQERAAVRPTLQFCAPFTLACLVRGYAELIQDIYEAPEFVHELLAFLTDRVIAPWIAAQKAALPLAETAVGADALCSPPMTNLSIIEQFSIPYIQRLKQICPVEVAVINWWGDSCFQPVEQFLDLKLQVGSGLLRAQDPDVAKVGVGVFKEFASRHGLVLEIGVGEGLLNTGPPAAIRERIRRYILEGAPGGRFILYLASLDAGTPPEHVRAALRAAREFGRY